MIYKDIFAKLQEKNLEYLVVGGIAVNLHGYSRVTNDLDLLVLMDEKNIRKIVEAIKELGYKPRMPIDINDFISTENRTDWIENKNMKVFSVYNPKNELEVIDILLVYGLDLKEAYQNRESYNIGKIEIPTISIPDLVKLKEEAGREIDKLDINVLKRIMELRNE